jgi:hypothetical protein
VVSNAADCVKRAVERENCGNDQEERLAVVGKSGKRERRDEAPEYQQVAANQRPTVKIEDGDGGKRSSQNWGRSGLFYETVADADGLGARDYFDVEGGGVDGFRFRTLEVATSMAP